MGSRSSWGYLVFPFTQAPFASTQYLPPSTHSLVAMVPSALR